MSNKMIHKYPKISKEIQKDPKRFKKIQKRLKRSKDKNSPRIQKDPSVQKDPNIKYLASQAKKIQKDFKRSKGQIHLVKLTLNGQKGRLNFLWNERFRQISEKFFQKRSYVVNTGFNGKRNLTATVKFLAELKLNQKVNAFYRVMLFEFPSSLPSCFCLRGQPKNTVYLTVYLSCNILKNTQLGSKRSVEMFFYKSLFKNMLLCMNGRLSKLSSVHTYVMLRTVYLVESVYLNSHAAK